MFMRKLVTAAALLSAAIATPALARDGSLYVGVDAGIMKPNRLDLRFVNGATSVSDALRIRHKVGYDIDVVFGQDLGMFRLEGEFGYKRAALKDAEAAPAALAALSQPNLTTHYTATGRVRILSSMVNALVDLGPEDGFNGSVGIGAGGARTYYRTRLFPSSPLDFSNWDGAFAWQVLAQVRYPISQHFDAGIKYRYFQTGSLKLQASSYTLRERYKSHSVLASLVYNLSGPVQVAPPPPPPPPPAPPPTQTCPDGSVIPATDACPAPPPPPPPPPPAPERGV